MAVTTAQTPHKRPLIKRIAKRILPRTLLGRSLLIIVSPLVLVQVIATWVFYDRHYDTITKRLAQGIAGDVAAVIRVMGPASWALSPTTRAARPRTSWPISACGSISNCTRARTCPSTCRRPAGASSTRS
jgi:hypothetical protein